MRTSCRRCAARRPTTSRCPRRSRAASITSTRSWRSCRTCASSSALGKIGFDAWLQLLRRRGVRALTASRSSATAWSCAGHGLPTLIGCYHPSRQNTNTGKLTAGMMESVFRKATADAGVDGADGASRTRPGLNRNPVWWSPFAIHLVARAAGALHFLGCRHARPAGRGPAPRAACPARRASTTRP